MVTDFVEFYDRNTLLPSLATFTTLDDIDDHSDIRVEIPRKFPVGHAQAASC